MNIRGTEASPNVPRFGGECFLHRDGLPEPLQTQDVLDLQHTPSILLDVRLPIQCALVLTPSCQEGQCFPVLNLLGGTNASEAAAAVTFGILDTIS